MKREEFSKGSRERMFFDPIEGYSLKPEVGQYELALIVSHRPALLYPFKGHPVEGFCLVIIPWALANGPASNASAMAFRAASLSFSYLTLIPVLHDTLL